MTLNHTQEVELLKRPEAAAMLTVSVRTFDRYCAEGRIPKVSISKRAVRFRRSDVEALLESVTS